ncbi:hypothetical protein LQ953_08985 [Sphingomonas sp. IC-56]|uniref:hypothetical protein n=1 Tax=Sphingomonas sp. IC-56 TaxID=2898529 RepID=UPI001E4CE01C|nr:hypothetical protein [Sphingomonas sp. IC-56]MCD2324144.1 hypothetical protein [Sphingomonas sp. IC-56]
MTKFNALPAFTKEEEARAKVYLATQVAAMMGRKLEEGDWSTVYCRAKGIPDAGWSNLHIDVNYAGLGVEHKTLRCSQLGARSLKIACGTTMMHPSATRSIRIDDVEGDADDVMRDVFQQYSELIALRTDRVRQQAGGREPDMRIGWLLWEDNLTEFLYFEERMVAPDPSRYYAEWNVTAARGARKPSRSLWVYDRDTHQKRYSVTTSAGIKIQPYFDVPPPADPNLYYFRVQGEPVGDGLVQMWVAASTAIALRRQLGSLEQESVSAAIVTLIEQGVSPDMPAATGEDLAVGVVVSSRAYSMLTTAWEAVSDEHRAQLLLKALQQ